MLYKDQSVLSKESTQTVPNFTYFLKLLKSSIFWKEQVSLFLMQPLLLLKFPNTLVKPHHLHLYWNDKSETHNYIEIQKYRPILILKWKYLDPSLYWWSRKTPIKKHIRTNWYSVRCPPRLSSNFCFWIPCLMLSKSDFSTLQLV